MRKILEEIRKNLKDLKNINKSDLKRNLNSFFLKINSKVDKFIGDYPTFIEPVYLEEDVKIGDDVLLGPNVFISTNSEIGDYTEISNSIIFENVKIGQNLKLENCIIVENSNLNFNNIILKNWILSGTSNSEDNIKKIDF